MSGGQRRVEGFIDDLQDFTIPDFQSQLFQYVSVLNVKYYTCFRCKDNNFYTFLGVKMLNITPVLGVKMLNITPVLGVKMLNITPVLGVKMIIFIPF